jgi:hypothetical protein
MNEAKIDKMKMNSMDNNDNNASSFGYNISNSEETLYDSPPMSKLKNMKLLEEVTEQEDERTPSPNFDVKWPKVNKNWNLEVK